MQGLTREEYCKKFPKANVQEDDVTFKVTESGIGVRISSSGLANIDQVNEDIELDPLEEFELLAAMSSYSVTEQTIAEEHAKEMVREADYYKRLKVNTSKGLTRTHIFEALGFAVVGIIIVGLWNYLLL